MTTLTSRLDAEAKVLVTFDPPFLYTPRHTHDGPMFLTSATFRQAGRHIYGGGTGVAAKKDGSIGRATRHVYSLRPDDMPDDLGSQVKQHLAEQLARVAPEEES